MPTYQYRCSACSHELEAVQKFTEPALTECPACSGRLRKVFNAVGVVFKGSGFYRTDSRADSTKAAGTANGKTESSSGDTPAGGSGSSSPEKSGGKQPATAGTSSSAGSSSAGSSSGKPSGAGSSSTAA